MRIALVLLGLAGCSAETAASPPAAPGPTSPTTSECATETLAVGESRTLPAADAKSYSVGRAGVVDVKPGKDFTIVGKQPGTTDFRLVSRSGDATCVRYEVRSSS